MTHLEMSLLEKSLFLPHELHSWVLKFFKSILQQQISPSDKDDDLKAFFIFIFTTLIIYIDIVNKKMAHCAYVEHRLTHKLVAKLPGFRALSHIEATAKQSHWAITIYWIFVSMAVSVGWRCDGGELSIRGSLNWQWKRDLSP